MNKKKIIKGKIRQLISRYCHISKDSEKIR
jgi:hypothetical protein